jgi:cation diffusion facilitator family transporter
VSSSPLALSHWPKSFIERRQTEVIEKILRHCGLWEETLYRFVLKVGAELTSTAVKGDAWHHRSDVITSAAAFVGISIALIGGKGYESADDWAALLACAVILFNGYRIFRAALGEIIDAAVPSDLQDEIRQTSSSVPGVVWIEKCRARKSGLGLLVEIHVEVDGDLTVRRGHEIGHAVSDHLKSSSLSIQHVVVHVEPALPAGCPRIRHDRDGGIASVPPVLMSDATQGGFRLVQGPPD